MMLRVPPHSIDAEQAVLGGLMIDQRAIERVLAELSEADFYRKDHRLIFRAIVDLDAKGGACDAVTMGDWFEANGLADQVGGTSYILNLANNTPGVANIAAHARIVREKSVLRQIIEAGEQISGSGFDPNGQTPTEILDATIQRLMTMQRHDSQVEFTAKQAAKRAYDAMIEAHMHGGAPNRIPSGLSDLDDMLGGFHAGDLIVIGARPAMGKTSLLINAALHAANKGHAVGIISGEQPADQIAARMIALTGNIPAKKFRTGKFEEEEWPRVTNAFADLQKARLWILDRSAPHITEVARVARRWKQLHGIEAAYVDYMQRIEAKGERRWESVGAVAKGLKNLARDLSIPVIVLAQVSREAEGRIPRMADLSDSSEIEKEADQILMLYRDEAVPGVAKIIVEKNRHGATGFIEAAWIAETMRFADLAYSDREAA
jgi:replicative DNA helicase